MATYKAVTVVEQNANVIAGVQAISTLIGSATPLVFRAGRESPVIVLTGTQTASLGQVIVENVNAKQGDVVVIKKYTTAVLGTGASQIQVLAGTAAGLVIGAFQLGTAAPNEVRCYFDGVQWN